MLIAFTGPQSSGKTTLIDAIKSYTANTDRQFEYKQSATRTLKSKGFTINNIGDNFDATQRAVIDSHIENVDFYLNHPYSNLILDRCILDGVVYTIYDRVFYLDPTGVPLVNDNERSTDVIFRRDVIQIFNEYLEHYPTIKLTGSVEDRLNTIKQYL